MHSEYEDRLKNDPRFTDELIKLALTREEDEHAYWEPLTVLHRRGSREVFEAALTLCESPNPKRRTLGVHILGQLGVPQRTFPEESLPILFRCLEDEDVAVLRATAIALGHIHDSRVIERLITLKNHPDAEVRNGVAFGIGISGYDNPLAISTLIELSRDENQDVRNWATFALGSQTETDTKEVRQALVERLQDDDDETRGEALVGLASRKDERILAPLTKELASRSVGRLPLEAARRIGDSRLYPALIQLRNRGDVDIALLEDAINSCQSQT